MSSTIIITENYAQAKNIARRYDLQDSWCWANDPFKLEGLKGRRIIIDRMLPTKIKYRILVEKALIAASSVEYAE